MADQNKQTAKTRIQRHTREPGIMAMAWLSLGVVVVLMFFLVPLVARVFPLRFHRSLPRRGLRFSPAWSWSVDIARCAPFRSFTSN